MEDVVRTYDLSKRYGSHAVVNELNMTVRRGDVYGFLGLNGAGKTTTLRMLLGLIHPNGGRAEILGEKVAANRTSLLRRVGCLIETPGFYPNLTAFDNLDIQRRIYGVKGAGCIAQALDTVGLGHERKKPVGAYSLGMRQRLGLARALLHSPELLLLDEPTNGLDPIGIREMRELIRALAEEQKITILMSSHILSEVQQLATRVGIIHNGRLIEEVDRAQLMERTRSYLEMKVDSPEKAVWVLEEHLKLKEFEVAGQGVLRLYAGYNRPGDINRELVTHGVLVERLYTNEENLEDHFIKLTGQGTGTPAMAAAR